MDTINSWDVRVYCVICASVRWFAVVQILQLRRFRPNFFVEKAAVNYNDISRTPCPKSRILPRQKQSSPVIACFLSLIIRDFRIMTSSVTCGNNCAYPHTTAVAVFSGYSSLKTDRRNVVLADVLPMQFVERFCRLHCFHLTSC
jgi:hypothetical protein